MSSLRPLTELDPARFDSPEILKQMVLAARQLAELKGVAASMPQQGILIDTLGLQEAKDSSAIENIITTHDDLFREDAFPGGPNNVAAKEVRRYRNALAAGFHSSRQAGLLTNEHILQVQATLEQNDAGFRKLPETTLKNSLGETIYTPPQDHATIVNLMADLERFINIPESFAADPLVKMALLHHQFESIHPFYDGNGRTGRILNVLYLVHQGLLDIPVLYLSRYIVRTKSDYYRLLQTVRVTDEWEQWVLYMLRGVEETARQTIVIINEIAAAMLAAKHSIRSRHRFYSQDLINHLFSHPYTKTEYLKDHLKISRPTATHYLDILTADGLLEKQRIGRTNYYINRALYDILTG